MKKRHWRLFKADEKKPKKDITPSGILNAFAATAKESRQRTLAHQDPGGFHGLQSHEQKFIAHMAAASHHAVLSDIAKEAPKNEYISEQHPKGLNYNALREAHKRISTAHLAEAHKVASQHPEVWNKIHNAPPEDKYLVAASVGASHPMANARKGESREWLADWAWANKSPHEMGKNPLAPHPQVATNPERLVSEHSDITEAPSGEFDLTPGAGHWGDKFLPAVKGKK